LPVPRDVKELIGRQIRLARERAGLTQAKLAEAAGIADETVSRIERGAYEPAVSTLISIGEALGIGLDVIAEGAPVAAEYTSSNAALVRRLSERAAQLDASAVRALIQVAEMLPVKPKGWHDGKGKGRKRR
jgi:transcriptional regulator with XRE-family HTH domain